MKCILFYYPSNKRSVQIETTLIQLKQAGYKIIFLTTCPKGDIHHQLEQNNIETDSNVISAQNSILYYIKQLLFFIKFCKKNKIDLVFSNLQHTNFIASIGRFFIQSRVIAFRHHFKFNQGNYGIPLKINKNEVLFDKVINVLAKQIVVPSEGVYNGIVKFEHLSKSKLHIIPYMYDFSKYKQPNTIRVDEIKQKFNAQLRIIMVARLIPFKRHILMFPLFKKLINEGLSLQIIVLDDGPEKENLLNWINENKMEEHIHLLGFQKDFIDYMMAADLLIHPSLTEASNNVVKEIGLLNKSVAVCNGVGDFNDYIVDGKNGYFLDIEKPEITANTIIRELYNNPEKIKVTGDHLKETILTRFSSNESVLKKYIELIEDAK